MSHLSAGSAWIETKKQPAEISDRLQTPPPYLKTPKINSTTMLSKATQPTTTKPNLEIGSNSSQTAVIQLCFGRLTHQNCIPIALLSGISALIPRP